jgi:hypothetical protein
VTSDWESNQQVSALPVTAQELPAVCELRVSVSSVLNSLLECHFELSLSLANVLAITYSVQIYSFVRLYIIVTCWQSWSGISKGKAVLSDGGCCQFLSEQVSWCIILSTSSAPHHLQGTPVLQVCVMWDTCCCLICLFQRFLENIKLWYSSDLRALFDVRYAGSLRRSPIWVTGCHYFAIW